MRHATLPLLLLLSGCDGCQPTDELPDVVEAIPNTPAALWVGQGSGVGVAEVPVLTVNEIGAAVGGSDVSLTSGAALTAATATPDAYGYAWAEVTGTSAGAWDVAATQSSFTGTGIAFLTARPDVHVAFSAWLSGGQDTPIAHAGNGLAVAKGKELWWMPEAGGAPIRVLSLGDDIQGLRATTLDADGVGDLQVWSAGEAVLLRGRAEGGLAFAGGWRPKAGEVRAFTVVRLNEDELPDVLLVSGDANACTIIWMEYDGDEWIAQAALDQDFPAHGATAEDLDEDGLAEVTVLTGDGLLRRYSWLGAEEGWLALTTADSSLGISEGAALYGGFDFDDDLLDDIFVVGPKADGGGYGAFIVATGGDIPITYELAGNIKDPSAIGTAVADADADGLPDFFMSTPGMLYRGDWQAENGMFLLDSYAQVPTSLGIDAADVTGDDYVDLLISRAAAVALSGTSIPDDPDTEDDESVAWKFATPFTGLFDIGLTGDPWAGDFNGDGLVDVVSFIENGDPGIQAFYGTAANGATSENLRAARAIALASTDVPLDIAVCDGSVYTLFESGTGTVTRIYGIDGFGVLSLQGTVETDGGKQLACGKFANGEAAVTDDAGNVMWVNVGKPDVVEAGVGPWGDIVGVDRDGDGVDELEGCPGACTIAAADFDGDGLGDLAWSDGTDTTVSIGGLETQLGFGGYVSASDADGDGVLDVLVQADGVLAAWRGLGGRVGVPFASYIARDTRGRAYAGDLDGDTVPDAFWLGDERVADDNADWTGTLLYARAPDLATP